VLARLGKEWNANNLRCRSVQLTTQSLPVTDPVIIQETNNDSRGAEREMVGQKGPMASEDLGFPYFPNFLPRFEQ
jgi:hypothetical protein